MKKIVFMALMAIFTLSFTLEAQDTGRDRRGNTPPGGMRQTAKERADLMEKQLGLDANTKNKVLALLEIQDAKQAEEFAKMRENRSNQSQDREKLREEMMAQREKMTAENDAELEKIIGKEKMGKWKNYRDEQEKKMRSERPERQRPRR